MDRLSVMPDDLLLKILSFLPTTKVAVSTSILSKRWQFLWMWLPNLDYHTSSSRSECEMLRRFLNKNLPLHRAPDIESLCLAPVGRHVKPEDIKQWIHTAVSRNVRELEICYYSQNENVFPSNMYICKSLAVLRFSGVTLVDIPSMAHLPALKTLQFRCTLFTEETFQRLLSICPILEDLAVEFEASRENVKKFSIIVPTLQRLSLCGSPLWDLDGYVIDTPALTHLKFKEYGYYTQSSLFKNMPNLREAYVAVDDYEVYNSLIGSITSVKSLTIWPEGWCGGLVFNQLQHLKLCVSQHDTLHGIGRFLEDTPNLRVLDIYVSTIEFYYEEPDYLESWKQPSSFPECLLTSLQILKWSRFFRTQVEIDVAVYILQNACHLKKATFNVDRCAHSVMELNRLKELLLSSRSTCQLNFVEDGEDG